MKKNMIKTGLFSTLVLLGGCSGSSSEGISQQVENQKQRLNFLFIAIDDLRPELGAYGESRIHSPNIDQLAAGAVRFDRAYCNIAVCGASRASILTGTRPTRNTWINYYDAITEMRPDVKTLGHIFRENGWHTIHNGKVMHHAGDASGSWDEEWWSETSGSWRDYEDPENIHKDTALSLYPSYEALDVDDNVYRDGKIADKTIADLKKLKESGDPFFLAAGFLKPHLPFNAPKKYWELYDSADIVLPQNTKMPQNTPEVAMHNWGELRQYEGIPAEGPLTDEMAHKLKHGYYACVSYTDAQVGKVLRALEELDMAENTVVVLWGDHGWNLREHGLWCKHCNFETALQVPLIIRAPQLDMVNATSAITEFVDVYPTLCEMAGIPIPAHAEGKSLVPVITGEAEEVDGLAICRWKEGYTIIKEHYAYTEWLDSSDNTYASMLFDHAADPDENFNIAHKPENKELKETLSRELKENLGENFDRY